MSQPPTTPTLSMEGTHTVAPPMEPDEVEDAASASILANDTDIQSAEADDFETIAQKQVFSPRAEAEDDDTAEGTILGWGDRVVKSPYVRRSDIGSFGLYAGNWGGPSRAALIEQHIYHDLILRNPAQVLVAQEVDEIFAEILRNPAAGNKQIWTGASCIRGGGAKRDQ